MEDITYRGDLTQPLIEMKALVEEDFQQEKRIRNELQKCNDLVQACTRALAEAQQQRVAKHAQLAHHEFQYNHRMMEVFNALDEERLHVCETVKAVIQDRRDGIGGQECLTRLFTDLGQPKQSVKLLSISHPWNPPQQRMLTTSHSKTQTGYH